MDGATGGRAKSENFSLPTENYSRLWSSLSLEEFGLTVHESTLGRIPSPSPPINRRIHMTKPEPGMWVQRELGYLANQSKV